MSQVGVEQRFWWRVLDAPAAAEPMPTPMPHPTPPADRAPPPAYRPEAGLVAPLSETHSAPPRRQTAAPAPAMTPTPISSRVPLPWQVAPFTVPQEPAPAAKIAAEPVPAAPGVPLAVTIEPIDMREAGDARSRRRPGGARGAVRVLTLAAATAGVVMFAVLTGGGSSVRAGRPLLADLDAVLVHAGLGLDEVSIRGHRMTSDLTIFEALGQGAAKSSLLFDRRAARARIEALPWVARADIALRFPAGLDIAITERRAFAQWRHDGVTHLIDVAGRSLATVGTDERLALPLVTGAGAAAHASAILSLVQHWPRLAGELHHIERIAERRWDLVTRSGLRIRLPEDGEAAAMQELMGPQGHGVVLDLPLAAVDLRIAGRPSLTPQGARSANQSR